MLIAYSKSNLYILEGVVRMPRSKMQSGYIELEEKKLYFYL